MAKPKKEPTTRGIRYEISVEGRAAIDLEDIVGDRKLAGVDQDAAREKARDALEGCEVHGIDLDGLPFTFYLHVS